MTQQDDIVWTYYDNAHPGTVLEKLKRYLNYRLTRTPVSYWYVGQTDDPADRFRQHQDDCAARGDAPWTQMFVVYGHRDIGFVTDVENGLIRYLRDRGDRRKEEGGLNRAGARLGGKQDYHVYVLIDDDISPFRLSAANREFLYGETSKRSDTATRRAAVEDRFEKAIRVDGPRGPKVAKSIYVGVTNNPERRFAEHQNLMQTYYGGDLWDEMRVIYSTPSLNNALEVETLLIDRARTRYKDHTHNTASGRMARLFAADGTEYQPYWYVYYLEDRG